MCGISGVFGEMDPNILSQLIDAIAHRGPDQPPLHRHIGEYSGSACRLSIVDVRLGEQPILNQEETICVSMNGEVYNHAALRQELLCKGYHFTSSCDTEVVLHAYEEYGIDFLAQLEGMYAIALYDARINALYLVRDSLGIKPLYYCLSKGRFAYSSEIKSFFASELSLGNINENYLFYRFIFGFGPVSETLFTDIYPVIPGTYVSWRNDRVSIQRYRCSANSLEALQQYTDDPSREIERLLKLAVYTQIPAEVPWGIFLSGGVDSSILAYAAKQMTGASPLLFTVSDTSETSDLLSARTVARFLDTELFEFHASVDEIIPLFPHFIVSLEEFEPLNMFWYLLAYMAQKHIKVALCGQGADELFGGYPVYKDINLLASAFSKRLAQIRTYCPATVIEQAEALLRRLDGPEGLEVFYDFFMTAQLASFQLCPVDKCTMANGVEARVPYVSEHLVAYVRHLPTRVRLEGDIEKHLLRTAFRASNLPPLNRKKQFSGQQTLPLYYRRITDLAETIVPEEVWINHPYHFLFKSKAEMMSFDTLLYLLRKSKGSVPKNFLLKHLYD